MSNGFPQDCLTRTLLDTPNLKNALVKRQVQFPRGNFPTEVVENGVCHLAPMLLVVMLYQKQLVGLNTAHILQILIHSHNHLIVRDMGRSVYRSLHSTLLFCGPFLI